MLSFDGAFTNKDYANAYKFNQKKEKGFLYVEDESDASFWRDIIKSVANGKFEFEFGFAKPNSNQNDNRGKCFLKKKYDEAHSKAIVAVDSDYDYICQNSSLDANKLNNNPFILHTFSYSRESVQYSNKLIKDIVEKIKYVGDYVINIEFLIKKISKIIYKTFTFFAFFKNKNLSIAIDKDFNKIFECQIPKKILNDDFSFSEKLENQIINRTNSLYSKYSCFLIQHNMNLEYNSYVEKLASLGLTEDNTCRFICGHIFEDKIVLPILRAIKAKIQTLEIESINKKKHKTERLRIDTINKIQKHFEEKCSIKTLIHSNNSYKDDVIYKRILEKSSKAVE